MKENGSRASEQCNQTGPHGAEGDVRRRCGLRTLRFAAFALVACTACGELGGAGVARATFRDSAGVRIAENPSPDDSAALAWWRIEGPLLDIGSIGAEEPYALFRITGALRLRDDRFVVANGGSTDLRYYDAGGRHLATVGRSGEGPGEFRNLSLLMRGPGDSLLVYDGQARRFSVISPEPGFVRDFGLPDGGISLVIGRTSSGGLVSAPSRVRGSPNDMPTGVVRPDQTVTVHAASGELVDTIGTFPGAERIVRVRQQGGQIVSIEIMTAPFARTPSFALIRDELYVGTQDGPEIGRYALDGTQVLSIRTGRPLVPVTPAHVNALIENRLEAAPPEAHAEIRRGMEEAPHGEFIPPYGSLSVDAAGNLWVADYADPLAPGGRYTVYGEDGGVIARIVLPERFRPYDIGEDWILGRELDDLDVEHLRLYSIVR
jgi:hypothetical protein